MKAKISHIQSGILKWYLKDVASLGWKTTLATPLVNLGINNLFTKNANIINALTDENGEIDIEMLYKEYSEIICKSGSIELFGLKFNAQDVNSLYETIMAEIPR